MPDVIEPAASGRAKCRGCGEKIEKGALRFGEALPNPYGEGEETRGYYHLQCAGERRAEKLAAALENFSGEIPDRARVEQAMRDALTNPKLVPVKRAERSPTSRATCQECRQKIEKGALRVVIDRESEIAAMATTYFVHVECAKNAIGAGLADKLVRTSPELTDEDRVELSRVFA